MKFYNYADKILKGLTENLSSHVLPKVLYHGSKRRFDKLNIDFFGETDDGYYGRGIYFSTIEENANDYGWWIYKAHLINPITFFLSSEAGMGDILQARKDLSKLPEYKSITPNTKIPKGYGLVYAEDEGNGWRQPIKGWRVEPKDVMGEDSHWGEIMEDKEQAIIQFNDQIKYGHNSGPSHTGWTSGLLKYLGRKKFSDVLAKNGYNCLCTYDRDGINEVMVIDHDIIVIDQVYNKKNKYDVYESLEDDEL